ncbi:uncharacterized protein KNAG_0B05670 [Huiozyma naganishii CBS 8797]|uniref:Uncharacterized protein n=1 Tax=Huiozyma naganishii (strain ATCC MYA-139 / BCRC 22969 / CBS 8797 / KCTC 17520 / NBRC 10181 / NCYC 3082 / Yp74L-3) TaxID=1071383 RepID=J7S411_HUIN7|nr:hypothetical protein KNAG_0B05670 [Kazachstania naganishii CBS 8797]CCK68999.1 hypothetical protein KNAG_0B05670 [Kazachstania naganishii CBS 8797]
MHKYIRYSDLDTDSDSVIAYCIEESAAKTVSRGPTCAEWCHRVQNTVLPLLEALLTTASDSSRAVDDLVMQYTWYDQLPFAIAAVTQCQNARCTAAVGELTYWHCQLLARGYNNRANSARRSVCEMLPFLDSVLLLSEYTNAVTESLHLLLPGRSQATTQTPTAKRTLLRWLTARQQQYDEAAAAEAAAASAEEPLQSVSQSRCSSRSGNSPPYGSVAVAQMFVSALAAAVLEPGGGDSGGRRVLPDAGK